MSSFNTFSKEEARVLCMAIHKTRKDREQSKEHIADLRDLKTRVDDSWDKSERTNNNEDYKKAETLQKTYVNRLEAIVDGVEYGYIPAETKSTELLMGTLKGAQFTYRDAVLLVKQKECSADLTDQTNEMHQEIINHQAKRIVELEEEIERLRLIGRAS